MTKRTTKPPSDHEGKKTPSAGDKRKSISGKPPTDEREAVPPKTKTLPESRRTASLDDPDIVTWLHVVTAGVPGATQFELSAGQKRFTIGSRDTDVTINDPWLSASHCLLERRGVALRVTDLASHNGTFFGGRRLATFDIRPGDKFTASGTEILALNDEMHAAYGSLGEILGADDEQPGDATPSQFVLIATDGPHVLIVGEEGCDQELLARTLHGISLRRKKTLVELREVPSDRALQRQILDSASQSTLVLTITEDTPVMDDAFASSLFSQTYQIRVVVLAPTRSKAAKVLGEENLLTMKMIRLRPVSMRAGAIPRLLDQMFIERKTPLRFSDLTTANQTALQVYGWPKNLESLREAADYLPVIALHQPRLVRAAEDLALARSTLEYWVDDKLKLERTLVPEHVAVELRRQRQGA